MKKISFVTQNHYKLREAKALLPEFELHNVKLDIPEIQGDPLKIVEHKLRAAFDMLKAPVIVDDTCLEMEALAGLPGPYIKDFVHKMGITRLADLAQATGRSSARAVCIIGYMDSGRLELFSGAVSGSIVSPRGKDVFDWDQIFMPAGSDQTYAEMPLEKKNQISHRKLALGKLHQFLKREF